MEEIIWSSGEKYHKSSKKEKPLLDSENNIIQNIPLRGEILSKKNDRENELKNELKKEEIMERCMTVQAFQNPFLNKNFSSVLSDQETFLRPKNSNFINKEK